MIRVRAHLVAAFALALFGCGKQEADDKPRVEYRPKPIAPPVVEAKRDPLGELIANPPPSGVDDFRNQDLRNAAKGFEKTAQTAGKGRVYSWAKMMAAGTWLQADDKAKALAAAKDAIAAGPDDRSKSFTYQWHNGIADVLTQTGEIPLAIQHYEAALKLAPDAADAAATQKKLDAAKTPK